LFGVQSDAKARILVGEPNKNRILRFEEESVGDLLTIIKVS
jgi:hypothetical protein